VVIFLRAGSLAWHGIFPGPFGAGAAKITFFGSFELVLACFGFSVLQVRLPAAPAAMMRKLLPCAAACTWTTVGIIFSDSLLTAGSC
jgi:hypothetical protein